ncbi:MAG: AAA family ATPase [Candidatus Lokiarchaeota archaeon]|nr:AAA family ATPase [Candidatus Lokiarchaeota archaeon]
MLITITGGKGGTGKTLCAVNIASMFKNHGYNVLLIDGDVENPNTYLLLGGQLEKKVAVPFFKPKISEEKCTKCGLCAENCTTHALLHVNDSYPIPILSLCSGCKLCYKICPDKAIEEDYKVVGWTYKTIVNDITLMLGELKPSEARSAAIVESLLEDLDKIISENSNKYDVIILDTAPGAHCDVELLIKRADLVIPVTEPTKFGKMDLMRIMELIKLLGKDTKVIVNRSTLLGFKQEFLKELEERGIEILGDIPLDNDIVASYCQGIPIMDDKSTYNREGDGYIAFKQIFENLLKWMHNTNKKVK